MKIALLVIDMQKCFLAEYADKAPITECCSYINYVSGLVRDAGHLVIHIQDVEDAGEVSEDQLAFTDEIQLDDADLTVQKEYSNAFWKTNLESILTDKQIDLVVICGQAAEHCVLFTYNGASERGFKSAILQNAVLSQKPGRVQALMEDRQVISHSVVDLILKS